MKTMPTTGHARRVVSPFGSQPDPYIESMPRTVSRMRHTPAIFGA